MPKETHPELDLTIKDLTVHDKSVVVNERIPSVPLNLVIVGKSSCGKTNLLLNLVKWYRHIFKNRVIVFTKSVNGSLLSLQQTIGAKIFHSLAEHIENVIDFQKNRKSSGEPLDNILIIFDDFIVDSTFNKKRSIFDTLFAMARHYNISVVITSQNYTLIPASIRSMAWNIILFKLSNRENKKFLEEFGGCLDEDSDDAQKILRDATDRPYSFLYLNVVKNKFSYNFH